MTILSVFTCEISVEVELGRIARAAVSKVGISFTFHERLPVNQGKHVFFGTQGQKIAKREPRFLC